MQALKKLLLKKSVIATLIIFLLGFAGVKLAPDQVDAIAEAVVEVVDNLTENEPVQVVPEVVTVDPATELNVQ